MKKIILYSIIAVVVLGLGIVACKKQMTTTEDENTDKSTVSLTNVQMKNIGLDTVRMLNEVSELALMGKISVDEDKETKIYPLASGNVVKVNVTLGDHVVQGQVLAVIRSSEVNDFQNQYTVAMAALNVAKKNLDIAKQLYSTNVYSEKDVANAENDYKKATSDVNRIKQQLDILGSSAANTDAMYKVIAPIDGFIVEKNLTEGMQVRSDNTTQAFTVAYLNTVWMLADVYESDLSKVHLGDECDITTIAYPDKVFKGKIEKIGTLLDPNTKTLKIRVSLDNPEGLLKPEMFANVKVHANTSEKHLCVPTKAVVFDNSAFYVMVAQGANKFKRVQVHILRTVGDRTYLLDGVTPGELVVTDGSLLVSFAGA
jgi:cobalt-zinc-cadmium efflux system membrane fusion protein